MAQELSFYRGSVQPNRTTGKPWPPAWEDPNTSYSAPFVTMFLSTWFTWWEESNLPTYRGGKEPREAGDREAARAVFNGGGDGVRRCSGLKGFSGSGGVGRGSSSKWWISVGVSGVVTRRQCCGLAMAARVWTKFARDRALFIGVLHWIADGKNLNTFLVWIELYLVKIQKKSRRGQNRVGYNIGNRILGRVAQVKAETLSGSGRVCRVMPG
jgi:hypothetical protein